MTGPRNPPIWEALAGRPVDVIAEALGLTRWGVGYGPCPLCLVERRGRSDARGAVGISGDRRGWRCHACHGGGDGAALIAAVELGTTRPDAAGWARVRERAEAARLVAPSGPATAPARRGGGSMPPAAPDAATAPTRARDEAPRPAPAREVADLWRSASVVMCPAVARVRGLDPIPACDGARWLASRGLGGDRADGVALMGLARVLPPTGPDLPRWAGVGRMTWRDGWRLILPAFNAAGDLAALRARWIWDGKPEAGGKEIGGRGISHAGAVFADPVGRWLLGRGRAARGGDVAVWELGGWGPVIGAGWRWSGRVVIAEGGPDFLTAATEPGRGRTDRETAAILGVWSGGWTREIAARLPAGCEVRICTHADADGERYAAKIRATLPPDVVEVE